MTGTLINTVTVIAGAGLGTLIGDRLPDRIRQTVIYGIGLITLVLGMQMALTTGSILVVLLSIMLGGILGEWWTLEERLNGLGRSIEKAASKYPVLTRGDFTRGFVTASLVFCIGPMTFLGSIQDGLTGNFRLLTIKSVLDGFAGFAFAASMGFGVAFAAITVLLFQGGITLGAGFLHEVLTDSMIVEMTATGGVMILGIGLLLLDIKKVKVANYLPALVIAPLLELLRSTLL
ncbi:MAG: DUF554 domain-containing protein [Candidatus Fermentibacteraceae bacterium]|nr:DUF554 domain-containing protein [Candidatus Fermentibacteraceae bacterium]MBN2609392.1 DUF554 domain-containing protein [Candidatus Fermentibacteraceae bacterium]